MVVQVLVGDLGCVTDINVGCPGKVHEVHIFKNTGLPKAGTFSPDQHIHIGDLKMPITILGDPAYPLLLVLIKLYIHHLSRTKERFNYQLRSCRMTGECVFGGLKACWRCLMTRLVLSKANIPIVIAAFCILLYYIRVVKQRGKGYQQYGGVRCHQLPAEFEQPDKRAIIRANHGALRLREALKKSF